MKHRVLNYLLSLKVLALGLLLYGHAQASDYLTIATINYPPYSFAVEDKIDGITPALVKEAAKRAGFDIEIVVVPVKRVLKLTETGKFDAAFNLTWTPERAEVFDFGKEPLINEELVLVTRKDTDFPFTGDLNTLNGMRVGAVSGFSLGPRLDQAFKDGVLIKEENSSSEANIRMLMKGRVDIAASDKLSALGTMAAREHKGNLKLMMPPIESTPTFLAFTKVRDYSGAVKRFDEALAEMRASGVISTIIKAQLEKSF